MVKKVEYPVQETYTRNEIKFACEFCSFEADAQHGGATAVATHEFYAHQSKGKETINGVSFYLLEDKIDFENLLENGLRESYFDKHEGKFDKPGWYAVLVTEYDSGYGPHDYDCVAKIVPASYIADMWDSEREHIEHALHDLYNSKVME